LTGIILPHRDLNPAEETRYRAYILDLYSDFIVRVAAGRSMEPDHVETLARGRVYSGLAALNVGLIDSIGGLDDAVQTARKLAKISDNRKVVYDEYPKPKFFDKILEYMFTSEVSAGNSTAAAVLMTDLFLPGHLLDDLRFRIAHNGQVMPILPLGTVVK